MSKGKRAFVVALVAVALLGAARRPALAGRGEAGADFLQIIPSPRVVGTGEAGVALADDHLSALSVNPAGLARLRSPEAAFLYNLWFEGISLQNLSYAHPTREAGTFGFSGTWLQVKSIQGYDNSGAAAGDVQVQNMALKLAYARSFGPAPAQGRGLLVGGALKYVREKLDTVSASTVLFDLGTQYMRRVGRSTLSGGLALESLGQGLRFDSERDPPPSLMRLGLAYTFPVFEDPVSVVWDLRKPFHDELSNGVGVEYTTMRAVSWRLGWTSGQDLGSGLRVGIGLNLKVFSLDYSLARFGSLGSTHRIALTARFAAPPSNGPTDFQSEDRVQWHLDKGKRLMDDSRYFEAAQEFNEALSLDPHNRTALENLRLVRDLLKRMQ